MRLQWFHKKNIVTNYNDQFKTNKILKEKGWKKKK